MADSTSEDRLGFTEGTILLHLIFAMRQDQVNGGVNGNCVCSTHTLGIGSGICQAIQGFRNAHTHSHGSSLCYDHAASFRNFCSGTDQVNSAERVQNQRAFAKGTLDLWFVRIIAEISHKE